MKDKLQEIAEHIPRWIKEHKRISALLLAGIVVLGTGSGILITVLNKTKAVNGNGTYREYRAETGDITVGTSESGTISLAYTAVTFPVNATIDTFLVKSGQEVKEGDVLVKLDPESVTDGSSESSAKLEEAKLSLDQAVAEQKAKLLEAQQAYQSSLALSGYSAVEQTLSKQEITNTIEEARLNLEKASEELEKYQELQKSYPSDKKKLDELKEWMEEAKEMKENYENQLSSYQKKKKTVLDRISSLESELDKVENSYLSAKAAYEAAATEENEKALTEAKVKFDAAQSSYDSYYSDNEDVLDTQEELESAISRYTAEYKNYTTAYDDFKETYDENYKEEGDDLDQKVKELELSLKKAQVSYDKAQNQSKLSLLEADQKLQSSQAEINNAKTVYDLSARKLKLEVQNQQNTYNSLSRQLSDLESVISGDGTLTAPCDGIVSSVAYSDGDDIPAEQVILAISKPSELTLSISLSEEDVTAVSIGQEAEISLTAYDGQTFPAVVDSISIEPARLCFRQLHRYRQGHGRKHQYRLRGYER